MRRIYSTITLCLISLQISFGQKQDLKLSSDFINGQLEASAKQYQHLVSVVPANKFPKTFEAGEQKFSNSSWWCSGFYPGTLLYLSEGTGNSTLKQAGLDKLKELEKEQFNKGTHDLGFMLFCSFGNALRLTGDSSQYQPILKTGAESLTSRFNPTTKTIRSWDHNVWKFPVIIDNMMNLEFLMELSKTTGDKKYADVAITHANTTMKNHFRADNSSFHVIDYDPKTGEVLAKQTAQGAADESAWARGQAWGLYGYTMMYRETKDKAYLKQAQKIADYILKNPNLPADLIPYWDFDKDKIPSDSKTYSRRSLRDASAGAIIASALLELSQYSKGKVGKEYLRKAEEMLKSLSSETYFVKDGSNGGYLLAHSVGALPLNSEVDVPLTYADYYYVEALIRYQRMLAGEPIIKI
ncbi:MULTISPECIES: glycoside hydrolase family 88 protein [Sphingobacterium]|uniref:Glucuronyl hydrolase n=1 Tax=Sphingobacterium cellulitidis TaxID=1768011 RepID=A0A8H9G0R0_9SPHI|nr:MULTISPECIES: glycoside hydrolase family 88 protein [Sphingobacterium]MBA8987997.1 rhamnogalacturonyl hydrolase YesR [Sphingobacterium soli]OYD41382.1 glucuronyl hydrolase [Sphingobacterium cellulitidis]OYD45856.1 glucuronyl hydrolase [Sphingobacterium cellulitidis]WFB62948.1 glycoside hydrolase family 88 protein [Sphingobacterium sp. WM]GGE26455.1 glucuronyl hydrolase [Sphingobacterium soli]